MSAWNVPRDLQRRERSLSQIIAQNARSALSDHVTRACDGIGRDG